MDMKVKSVARMERKHMLDHVLDRGRVEIVLKLPL